MKEVISGRPVIERIHIERADVYEDTASGAGPGRRLLLDGSIVCRLRRGITPYIQRDQTRLWIVRDQARQQRGIVRLHRRWRDVLKVVVRAQFQHDQLRIGRVQVERLQMREVIADGITAHAIEEVVRGVRRGAGAQADNHLPEVVVGEVVSVLALRNRIAEEQDIGIRHGLWRNRTTSTEGVRGSTMRVHQRKDHNENGQTYRHQTEYHTPHGALYPSHEKWRPPLRATWPQTDGLGATPCRAASAPS